MPELFLEKLAALEEEYYERPVRVLVLNEKTLTLPSGTVVLHKGSETELPRRIAIALEEEGVVEIRDEGLSIDELARIHFSEMETQSPAEIKKLPRDFYMKAREYLKQLDVRLKSLDPRAFEEKRKAELFLNEIVEHRLRLILRLLQSGVNPSELADRLAPEEQVLYEYLSSRLREWKDHVLGGGGNG